MIFAKFIYDDCYEDIHDELIKYIKAKYPYIEYGLQCDSWIWINKNNEKVAIDTFSSMQHEIKSDHEKSKLTEEIISYLSKRYTLDILAEPEPEAHE